MRAIAACLAVVTIVASRTAYAREAGALHEDPEDLDDLEEDAFGTRGLVRTRAESVRFDARERSLELSGNVRIDSPPFYLRSQRIRLTRTRWGIEADGQGRLAFCPCLGTPLTIECEKAIVAPPGELILKSPKLEIYGVPVMYLPWFWMRSDEKVGLFPPDVAYRGQDGFFAGGGVHLPWTDRGARHSLDLRGGAYTRGGFVADARLRSPGATARIRYDRLPGAQAPELPWPSAGGSADDGLSVDARGASDADRTTIAWDADVLRGRRGVAATSDLDAAAKPWDRAAFAGAVRLGPIISETGVRSVTRRGGDLTALDAAGAFVALRSSGAVVSAITYDVTVEGGALRVSSAAASAVAREPPRITPDTISYARAEIGALGGTTFGPFAASLGARAAGDVAAEGRRHGSDQAASSRLHVGAPLVRAFTSADDDPYERNDPLVHGIEPFVAASVLHARGDAIVGTLPGRAMATVSGTAPVTEAGVTSTLGRWGRREAIEVAVAGGAAYRDAGTSPLARARISGSITWLGAQVETGHVVPVGGAPGGDAVVARLRFGRSDGPRVLSNIATRGGIDPVLARALTEPSIDVPAGFLAREGTTGGAGLVVPWARAITTSIGADVDVTAQKLVAARAGFELRDRCNCVTLRVNGSRRIGRDGMDVWLALDFATDR